jgi:2OG-Fe(II) oxygenase superfamily
MFVETALGTGALLAGAYVYARGRRRTLYRRLAGRTAEIVGQSRMPIADQHRTVPDFRDRLAVIRDILDATTFNTIKAEAERLVAAERSYVPAHKKGGTVAYETLIATSPAIVALYHSAALQGLVSRLAGETLVPTPFRDQSSLSVLFYDKPGDHIGWHYDHNFYRGRHFTVLIPLVNQGSAAGGLSHAQLIAKIGERERVIPTPPNVLVMFEGAAVRHKVVPVAAGERRVVLSMTYCADPSSDLAQDVARRIKDTAFFGIRALWT